NSIASGAADIGMVVGFDKHDGGAFSVDPESMGLPAWDGETGVMLTTQFFGLKVQRYLYEQDLDPSILQTVAAKAFRNGSLNPNAWRRKVLSEEEIAGSAMLSHPLTQ